MFEPSHVTIKSGEGKNYFEAEATIATTLDDSQARIIMQELRNMQKDRMTWAAEQNKSHVEPRAL